MTEEPAKPRFPIVVDDSAVFEEPWEARAFALVAQLKQDGVISEAEWAEAIGAEIAGARDRGEIDDGRRYYDFWLAAAEKLLSKKGFIG